jgi:SAM-dependent methyltransferase
MGASWTIPIVDGIPDFITYAPRTQRSLVFDIPLMEKPSLELLKPPVIREGPPKWFKEEKYKYPLLKDHRKGVLLDAGCGQGNRSSFEKLGYEYIGLDISFNSQQRCRGPSDLDIVADCHRLPLPSGSIEAINITAVLEHLYCPPLAVREFNRVLKSGGLLVGSCSFLEGEHFDSQHHYSYLGLYRLLKYAGLEVTHIYPGLSLWEMHSYSLYFSLPAHRWMGKLHRKLYLVLMGLKSKESAQKRLLRHAAILHFVAFKRS